MRARRKTTPAAIAIEIKITTPAARKRCRSKLNVENEWNSDATAPESPVGDVDTM